MFLDRSIIFRNQQGFNLLGVIVAIFIVAIGLSAIIGMVNSAIKGVYSTQNKIIASGLAQEGIEIVKNFRGNSNDWDTWFSNGVSGDYQAQYDSNQLAPYADTFLLRDPATGLYQYTTGTPTIFKRKIVAAVISANEIRFKSIVSWTERGAVKNLEVENRMWNWR
jgi:hypothetical protein